MLGLRFIKMLMIFARMFSYLPRSRNGEKAGTVRPTKQLDTVETAFGTAFVPYVC